MANMEAESIKRRARSIDSQAKTNNLFAETINYRAGMTYHGAVTTTTRYRAETANIWAETISHLTETANLEIRMDRLNVINQQVSLSVNVNFQLTILIKLIVLSAAQHFRVIRHLVNAFLPRPPRKPKTWDLGCCCEDCRRRCGLESDFWMIFMNIISNINTFLVCTRLNWCIIYAYPCLACKHIL